LDFPILKKINLRNEKLKALIAHKTAKGLTHPTTFPKMTKSVVDMVLMSPVKQVACGEKLSLACNYLLLF
jgi:hypothetical protein